MPKINGKLELYSRNNSACHGEPQLLVRSREGGFISKNCVACGEPRYVSLRELPRVRCQCCSNVMTSTIRSHNYYYHCENCERGFELWTRLPWWHEYFEFHGLGLAATTAGQAYTARGKQWHIGH